MTPLAPILTDGTATVPGQPAAAALVGGSGDAFARVAEAQAEGPQSAPSEDVLEPAETAGAIDLRRELEATPRDVQSAKPTSFFNVAATAAVEVSSSETATVTSLGAPAEIRGDGQTQSPRPPNLAGSEASVMSLIAEGSSKPTQERVLLASLGDRQTGLDPTMPARSAAPATQEGGQADNENWPQAASDRAASRDKSQGTQADGAVRLVSAPISDTGHSKQGTMPVLQELTSLPDRVSAAHAENNQPRLPKEVTAQTSPGTLSSLAPAIDAAGRPPGTGGHAELPLAAAPREGALTEVRARDQQGAERVPLQNQPIEPRTPPPLTANFPLSRPAPGDQSLKSPEGLPRLSVGPGDPARTSADAGGHLANPPSTPTSRVEGVSVTSVGTLAQDGTGQPTEDPSKGRNASRIEQVLLSDEVRVGPERPSTVYAAGLQSASPPLTPTLTSTTIPGREPRTEASLLEPSSAGVDVFSGETRVLETNTRAGTPMAPQAAPDLSRPTILQIVEAMRSGASQIDVMLSPEELGRVTLSLGTQDGVLSVLVQAERPETAELIRRSLDVLLAEAQNAGFEDVAFGFGGSGQNSSEHETSASNQAADPKDAQIDGGADTSGLAQRRDAGSSLDLRL